MRHDRKADSIYVYLCQLIQYPLFLCVLLYIAIPTINYCSCNSLDQLLHLADLEDGESTGMEICCCSCGLCSALPLGYHLDTLDPEWIRIKQQINETDQCHNDHTRHFGWLQVGPGMFMQQQEEVQSTCTQSQASHRLARELGIAESMWWCLV